jgi:hypothetical protein
MLDSEKLREIRDVNSERLRKIRVKIVSLFILISHINTMYLQAVKLTLTYVYLQLIMLIERMIILTITNICAIL